VKKSVARAKSKYFPAKNISLQHKIWLSAGIGAVILILAVIFLFPYLQGQTTVGKAGEQNLTVDQTLEHPGAKLCSYTGINYLDPSILCYAGKEAICAGGDLGEYSAFVSLMSVLMIQSQGAAETAPYFCDGFYWHECNQFNYNKLFNAPLASAKCTTKGGKAHFELVGVTDYTINLDNLYETRYLSMTALEWLPQEFITYLGPVGGPQFMTFFGKIVVGPEAEVGYSFCDLDTAKVSDQGTICEYADLPSETPTAKIVIDSVSELKSGAEQPLEKDGLLFLYEGQSIGFGGPGVQGPFKVADIILLKEIPAGEDIILPLQPFYNNLITGQRLAVKFEGEYYLLSHPNAPMFDFNNLKLIHLPTLQEFPAKHIPKNFYQFEVFGDQDKALNIYNQGDQIVFTITKPGEAPQVYPLPYDLSQKYEIPFSSSEPVKLVDLADTLLTVCTTDNPADPLNLLICEDGQQKLTLQRDQLTEAEIEGQKVALLFEIVTEADGSQKKQAHLFWRIELSNTIIDLDYNDLINNFVAGRRIAFSFGESVYLAKHPASQFISLPSIELSTYTESGKTVYPASGSEKKVGFLIPEGKIILERDFSTPPPPFKVKALTKQQIIDQPIDLEKQLFASMSNQIPVKITNPDFGIISVNPEDDISADKDLFKISTEEKLDFILKYGVPVVKENTLFYYFSASIDAGEFVKAVKIYRLYDLSNQQTGEHAFNDEFIKIFTAGNELAFKFDKSYYLLGYKGATEGTKAFFSLNDLTLKALNGSAEYGVIADLEAQTATFEVPEGNILIWKDGIHNLLEFSAATKDILTLEEFEEYSMLLTSENKIKINEVTYKICDNSNTEISDKIVLFCYGTEQKLLALDTPIILDGKLFWYQGKINGLKKIKVYSTEWITDEPITYPTWGDLQAKVIAGKSPAFSWQKQYFELTGTQNLDTFALKTIPDGELYPIQNVQSSIEDLQNGTFVFQSHLLQAVQEWAEGYNIQLSLTPLGYLLVTEEGFNLSADQNDLLFTPSLGAPIYYVDLTKFYPELALVILYDKEEIFAFYLLPPGKIQVVLLPNGEVIEIEAISTTKVTLKK